LRIYTHTQHFDASHITSLYQRVDNFAMSDIAAISAPSHCRRSHLSFAAYADCRRLSCCRISVLPLTLLCFRRYADDIIDAEAPPPAAAAVFTPPCAAARGWPPALSASAAAAAAARRRHIAARRFRFAGRRRD